MIVLAQSDMGAEMGFNGFRHKTNDLFVKNIVAVPLTRCRHIGLDPVSSKLLKTLDSGSALAENCSCVFCTSAVPGGRARNDGVSFGFHIS